jgi:2-iminobutanoate/2-iminopropanoate deaminase
MSAPSRRIAAPVPGLHGAAAGRLVTVGGMLFTSSITGTDPDSGALGPSADREIRTAFSNLRSLLDAANADTANIGLITAALPTGQHTESFGRAWAEQFPDPDNAPMLKVNTYPLPDGQSIQIQATGMERGQRRIVEVAEITGGSPRGARLGDCVFSGVIDGRDPASGQLNSDPKNQMRQAFDNMSRFIEAAGGCAEDLIHVLIFVRGREDQADMLDAWLAAFPEDGNRPARKAIFDPTLKDEGKCIQLLCVGHLGQGARANLEVPGISKRHPNPMGCKIGNLMFSSGVGGDDPSGAATGQDPEMRAELALHNMEALMNSAGGGIEDIGMVAITVNTYSDQAAILRQWDRVFPDPRRAPARHLMAFGGRSSYPVQLHIIAALPRD